jgi:two-component system cell cycle sensor histidine kinase/response regulator CckA
VLADNVELTADLAGDLGVIEADPTQVEQILLNLAVNAQDAMPDGGDLRLRTFNTPPVEGDIHPLGCVVLVVADGGQGIPDDVLPHIFEPFFTTKAATEGTGLGLSTAYGIIEQSGGHIDVRSEVGVGTEVEIRFPRVGGRPLPLVDAEPVAPATHSDGARILLVEDSASVRLVTYLMLQRAGYKVFPAADAEEAQRLAAEHSGNFDLLITDLVMPGVPGTALAESLRESMPALPVLFISGHAEPLLGDGRKLPTRARFLSKPLTPAELENAVEELLRLTEAS